MVCPKKYIWAPVQSSTLSTDTKMLFLLLGCCWPWLSRILIFQSHTLTASCLNAALKFGTLPFHASLNRSPALCCHLSANVKGSSQFCSLFNLWSARVFVFGSAVTMLLHTLTYLLYLQCDQQPAPHSKHRTSWCAFWTGCMKRQVAL